MANGLKVSFAELVASLRVEGKSVKQHLQELYERFGSSVTL